MCVQKQFVALLNLFRSLLALVSAQLSGTAGELAGCIVPNPTFT